MGHAVGDDDHKGSLGEALGLLRGMLRAPAGFDPATSRRTFSIAMQEQPAAALAPALAAAVLRAAPAVRLAFVRPEGDAAAQLEEGAVDLVVAPAEQASGSLMVRALLDNDFLTAQRKGHPRGLGPLVVAGTDCLCTLPGRLLHRFEAEVDLFPPPLPLPRPSLVALWHARDQDDPGHRWLRDCVYRAVGS